MASSTVAKGSAKRRSGREDDLSTRTFPSSLSPPSQTKGAPVAPHGDPRCPRADGARPATRAASSSRTGVTCVPQQRRSPGPPPGPGRGSFGRVHATPAALAPANRGSTCSPASSTLSATRTASARARSRTGRPSESPMAAQAPPQQPAPPIHSLSATAKKNQWCSVWLQEWFRVNSRRIGKSASIYEMSMTRELTRDMTPAA
jgi:hypothetical protein